MMQKVVIFYPHVGEYGGIERNILALADYALSVGQVPVLVCYYDHVGLDQYCTGLTIVKLQDHWNPMIKARRLRNWLRDHRQEIFGTPFVFGAKAGFYAAMGNIGRYTLHYTDPPSLLMSATGETQQTNLISLPRKRFSEWLIAQGVRKASSRLTMTSRNAVELQSIYKTPFQVILQGGVPPAGLINTQPRLNHSTLRLFSLCRISASKNLDWILDAALAIQDDQFIQQHFQKIEIEIAGTGPYLDILKDKAKTMGLNAIISFSGFLSAVEIEDKYSQADLFLVPAVQGYGLPVLEALYRHVPVVLNIETRISEILSDNQWVGISENNSASFTLATIDHIKRLKTNYPSQDQINTLPTESGWAEKISVCCEWKTAI